MRDMEQLSFQLAMNEPGLKSFFETALKRPVDLTITDNSSRMLSFKRQGKGIALRLNRAFLVAPMNVLTEAAMFIRKRGGPTPLVTRFLREMPTPAARARKAKARTQGKNHDLAPLFEKINREYFSESIEATITWSRRQRGRVRRRTLGSYCSRSRTVRINPVLDSPKIPVLFVEYIVYHEMLHAFIKVKETGGRRQVHSKEFREKEKEFRGFAEVIKWERANRGIL